ncbi:hypothetical protein DSO57_1013309 [Entomophthora muscae]|uniref:Uncharacterized protein n=1 Tax=Entomophthora muscae TaxID=34485 RepID=A0ACC2TH32_9FUNG|nr:hypothetical protein DSO57_1013309 [Entomophthora muscae]
MVGEKLVVACQENYQFLTGLGYDKCAQDEHVSVVQPSKAVAEFIQKLSPLDRVMAGFWTPTMYAFETPGKEMDPESLKRSLSLALDKAPTLAGLLYNLDGSKDTISSGKEYAIRCPGPGVWFAHETIQADFQEMKKQMFNYEMLPSRHRFKRFIDAVPAYLKGGPSAPLLAIKASYFPCGSVLLLIYINHLVADGRACYEFIKLWSEISRNSTANDLFDARHLFVPDGKITPAALEKAKASKPFSKAEDKFTSFRACTITIPVSSMQSLKRKINSELEPLGEFVTIDDLFTAVVWRAITRARQITAKTCIQRSIDVRKRLSPPNSLCNGIICDPSCPLDAQVLTSLPLAQVALLLRHQVQAASHPQYLQDYLNSLAISLPSHASPQFVNFWFNNDLLVSSYAKFLPSEINFGDAPAIQMARAIYFEGHLVTYPAIHHQNYAVLGISQDHVHRFLKDAELLNLGFTPKLPPL